MKTAKLLLSFALAGAFSVNSFAHAVKRADSFARSSSSAVEAQDRTFTHKEAGIQFELPEGWKAQADGDVLTVSTPDDSLQMVFYVPGEEGVDAAADALDKEIGKRLKNIKTDGPVKKDKLNGIDLYSQSGTGEAEGVTLKWSVDLLAAKKPIIVLSFAAPGVWEKHSAGLAALVNSIKRV